MMNMKTGSGFILLSLLISVNSQYLTPSQYTLTPDKTSDVPFTNCFESTDDDNIYKYSIQNVFENETINFSDYRGKILLIVNVASWCKSSKQYPFFNPIQDTFADNLQIVGFPCNQFLNVSLMYD